MAEHVPRADDEHRRRADERAFLREVERAQEQLERNTRTIADVLVEAMESGYAVTILVGSASFTGRVTGVNNTLLRLVDRGGEVDLNLELLTELRSRRADAIGPTSVHPVPTLLGRLRELAGAASGTTVHVGTAAGTEVHGEVEAAAADHVELRDQNGTLVALRTAGVAWLRADA